MDERKKEKVLVVEDDEAVATLIAGVAEKQGYQTSVCGNAEEAQKQWMAEGHELIILDLNLPGMKGMDYCRWIRAQERERGREGDTFILVSTGNTKVETFHGVLEAGANDYIPKPVSPALLAIRLGVAHNTMTQVRSKREFQGESDRKEKRFQLISENSRDLVCTHSPDGKISYVSPACRNILGFEPSELLGKSFDGIKMDKKADPLNLEAAEDGENGNLETTRRWATKTKEGDVVWLETYTQTGMELGEARVTEIYSYSRDVTEEVKEEEQLRILSVLGEGEDSQSFLLAMIEEMEQKLEGSVVIHIHPSTPGALSYSVKNKRMGEDALLAHKNLNRETPPDKLIFQGRNAGGVYNHVEGCGALEAVLSVPITGTYGEPIGKITITSEGKITESERTKAVLVLCAGKIGNVLENHVTKG
jgi:PAS domain S-box-containing protein